MDWCLACNKKTVNKNIRKKENSPYSISIEEKLYVYFDKD